MRRDFLAAQLQGTLGDVVHHFLVLVKHRAQVLASEMLSTGDGSASLCFTNHMTISDLREDFRVSLNVYALVSLFAGGSTSKPK